MFRLLFAILAILISGMNLATVTVMDSRRPRPEGVMIALAEKIN
jgi:hypothetical protein